MKAGRKKRGWVYRGSRMAVAALAIGVCMLWISSFIWVFEIGYYPRSSDRSHEIEISVGSISYYSALPMVFNTPGYGGNNFNPYPTSKRVQSTWRFYCQHYHDDLVQTYRTSWWNFWLKYESQTWGFRFPLWAPLIFLSIWPVFTVIQWVRMRPRPGHCPACGYDLRGSIGSTTCPECGEAIPRPAAQDAGG